MDRVSEPQGGKPSGTVLRVPFYPEAGAGVAQSTQQVMAFVIKGLIRAQIFQGDGHGSA